MFTVLGSLSNWQAAMQRHKKHKKKQCDGLASLKHIGKMDMITVSLLIKISL